MYRKLIPIIYIPLLFLCPPASAAELLKRPLAFRFFAEPAFGFETGSVSEIVFNQGRMLSRLDWQDHLLSFMQLDTGFLIYGVYIGGSIRLIPPADSGIMEDFDWMLASRPSSLTNYSYHDQRIDRRLTGDLRLGYRLDFMPFSLLPQAGVRFINRKWTARDGGYRYARTGDLAGGNVSEGTFSGTVIEYGQFAVLPFVGLGIEYPLLTSYLIRLSVVVYPYVYVDSIDNHVLRSTYFYDFMRGGGGVLVSLGLSRRIWQRGGTVLEAGFLMQYEYFSVKKGYSFAEYGGKKSSLASVPGTESSQFSCAFSLRIHYDPSF